MLPLQDVADIVRLALADHQLERVAQGNEPALAAERAHLANVVHVHDGIAMDPPELLFSEPVFERPQSLGRQEALFPGNDPNQLALCLKGENFVGIEKKVIRPVAAHNLSTRCPGRGVQRCGGDLGDSVGDLERFVSQTSRALYRSFQSCFADRLQQVIDGSRFKSVNRVLVIGGHDHDDGRRSAAEFPDDFKSSHDGHVKVEEHQVRLKSRDLLEGLFAILGFSNDHDFFKGFQVLSQDLSRDRLIVHDQSLHRGRTHAS